MEKFDNSSIEIFPQKTLNINNNLFETFWVFWVCGGELKINLEEFF